MRARLITSLLTLLWLAACGDAAVDFFARDGSAADPTRVVGGACATNSECAAGSLCLTGEEFPAGSCALPCQLATTCPSNTLCVQLDESHGFPVASACLPSCAIATDCRSGYECGTAKRVGEEVEVGVCIN